ncbi:hypothetical protein ACLF6K_38365 (plasmid) [Streptomyces xanthophaeus]|uniref:hypothetical protein n=1 Tax=Streptomyces xanthophaeus TaxID=67385 RepID=UPI00398FA368
MESWLYGQTVGGSLFCLASVPFWCASTICARVRTAPPPHRFRLVIGLILRGAFGPALFTDLAGPVRCHLQTLAAATPRVIVTGVLR